MSETKTDIYSRITNRIIADLEQGVRPWIGHGMPSMPPAGSPARCAITASPTRASTS